jgi:hypothetical protein
MSIRVITGRCRDHPDDSLSKMVGVDLSKMLPLLRDVLITKDRFDRARGLARATVDALIGMDVKHLGGFELGLILAGMNAVHRTNVDASRVFGPNTGFADHVCCHYRYLLPQLSGYSRQ